MAPRAFQRLLDRVKPERDHIRDPGSRQRWWRFGRDKAELRRALAGMPRYIVTPEVSKHRCFAFVDSRVRPDHTLVAIALDDAYAIGVLSSRIQEAWALAAGGTLEDRPRYNRTLCFDPFPFPAPTDAQRARIRDLGESLDAHRKRQQALHSGLTITGMYNVLDKLRSGEALTAKEKVVHEQGLVSVLKQIHDDLDDAVFEAYGWPRDLSDEQILERLVALNHERADEESRGIVRWLRPEYQAPATAAGGAGTQDALVEDDGAPSKPKAAKAALGAAMAAQPWPKTLAERVAAVRGLLSRRSQAWSLDEVRKSFTRARAADIEEVLDALVALGLLVAYDAPQGRRWRQAAAAGSASP